jgi:hypothetical protein
LNNKALEIISTFSKAELNEFNKFITSPFFNNNSKVTDYYSYMQKFNLHSGNSDRNEEDIFTHIYPGEKYRNDRIRKLSSELYKLAQRFISQKRFDTNKILNKRFLIEELSERKLDKLFELRIDDVKKETANISKEDFNFLHELFNLENTEVTFHLERNNQAKTKETVLKRGEHLITYFLMMFFKNIDDMEANASSYNAEYEGSLLDEFNKNFNAANVIEFIKKNNLLHSHSLIIYYSLFTAWRDFDNDRLYLEARELVNENFDKLRMNDKESVIVIMMNYCIKKFYYTQNPVYNQEKFFIYKLYLKHKIYKNAKNLGRTMYMNILKLAIMIGEFEWANEFVDKYVTEFGIGAADSGDIEMMRHFSYAMIAFHNKDYKKALKESSKVTAGIEEMSDKIGLKTYIICSHYELGDYDAAYEELKNFKVFLKNNNISGYFRNPALNYTKALTKLLSYNLSTRRQKKGQDALEKYITELGVMNFRSWVLKKTQELK